MKFSAFVLVAASGLALATKVAPHAPKESQHLDWDKVHEARLEAKAAGIDRRAASKPTKDNRPLKYQSNHETLVATKDTTFDVKVAKQDAVRLAKVHSTGNSEAVRRGVAAREPTKDNRDLEYQSNHETLITTQDNTFDIQVAKKDAVRLAKVRSTGNAKAMRRRRGVAAREPTKDNRDLDYQSNHETLITTQDNTFDIQVAKKDAVRLAKVHSTGNAKAL